MESNPLSRVGLRDRHKARRRAAIVSAAAELWRSQDVGSVSIQQIAALAEVAPQTVYNLIGGLDALMFAVIDELLDRLALVLDEHKDARGVMRAVQCTEISAELFCQDERLYRQLIVKIPQTVFSGSNANNDSAQIQVDAVLKAQAEGDISKDFDAVALGAHIFMGYMGSLYAWGCGSLSNDAFVRAAQLSAVTPLIACATPSGRSRLEPLLHELLAGPLGARALTS